MRTIARGFMSFAIATTTVVSQVSAAGAAGRAGLPPSAVDDIAVLAEDALATEIPVLANDSDPDGDKLIIVRVTQGAHGTVAVAGDAPVYGCRYPTRCRGTTLSYAPAADFNGTDTFTYTITDRHLGQATASVHVTVQARNDAPSFTIAGDQSAIDSDGPQTVVGFASGSAGPADESGQTLRYVIDAFSAPVSGDDEFSLQGLNLFAVPPTISPAGDLTFTPKPGSGGGEPASITVHLVDSGPNGNGNVNHSQEQTFLISIGNEPPVAMADGPYIVPEGGTLFRHSGEGVLQNDLPGSGALTAVLDTDVAHGTLVLQANGAFTYTPTALFVGSDSFTYHAHQVNSGIDSSAVAVSITVYVNHAPVAVGDSATVVAPRDWVDLDVLANDNAANPDPGERLLVTDVSQPAHGTTLINGTGSDVQYLPTFMFVGTDAFTYTISDGVLTATATVQVNVLEDTFGPVSATPRVHLSGQRKLGASTVDLGVSWLVQDVGTGAWTAEVWKSVNDGPFVKLPTIGISGNDAGFPVAATLGSRVRFRVQATDRVGNVGNLVYSPTVKVALYQETAASYLNPWRSTTNAVYSGGRVAFTSNGGFDATFTATGRSFAWIGVLGPNRGSAAIFVDGIRDYPRFLTVPRYFYRAMLFTVNFSTSGVHTIRIVSTSPGKRIDIDGFVVLD